LAEHGNPCVVAALPRDQLSIRKQAISRDEIRRAFDGDDRWKPIMTPAELASLHGLSVKTIYAWLAAGRLNGAYRKRGKHCLIWRDRAVELLFNGPDWAPVTTDGQ
jgi:excisionase family DNA binding protein